MGRPVKSRRVCQLPESLAFYPETPGGDTPVVLTFEQVETLRLMDWEDLSQEECAQLLGVSRATVQSIYARARKRIAKALVMGLPIRIQGGDYRLCAGGDCPLSCCPRKQEAYKIEKGEHTMRIAVTYEKGEIYQHFGHTAQFKVYDMEGGQVVSARVVDTNGQGHGALAGVLSGLQVDALICGGIGGGARMALEEAGIRLYGGVSGDADEAVAALLENKLSYNPDVQCSHHHGEGEHHCGSHAGHTCGHGSCGQH